MEEIRDILSPHFIEFIKEHSADDIVKLILSRDKYPSIDIGLAATIIEGRRKIANKVPEWGERFDLYYPNTLATEQSSSFRTATYKQQFIEEGTVIDLTGGLGIDTYYMAKKTERLIYLERDSQLCAAAQYNFAKLGATNIVTHNCEINKENLSTVINGNKQTAQKTPYSLIYLDPDRRGSNNKRIYAISDCEPNIIDLKEELFRHTNKILVKVSPMADIKSLIKELPEVASTHILSIENECKEVLLLLSKEQQYKPEEVKIACVNFTKNGSDNPFIFTYIDELHAIPDYASHIKEYLYEPDSSILKAGAFKTISKIYGIEKLEINTHLYTSSKAIKEFPGRVFKVKEVMEYNNRVLHNLSKIYPKANVSVRNFPLSADQLRKKADIEDGGDTYLIGTTISIERRSTKKIIICERV